MAPVPSSVTCTLLLLSLSLSQPSLALPVDISQLIDPISAAEEEGGLEARRVMDRSVFNVPVRTEPPLPKCPPGTQRVTEEGPCVTKAPSISYGDKFLFDSIRNFYKTKPGTSSPTPHRRRRPTRPTSTTTTQGYEEVPPYEIEESPPNVVRVKEEGSGSGSGPYNPNPPPNYGPTEPAAERETTTSPALPELSPALTTQSTPTSTTTEMGEPMSVGVSSRTPTPPSTSRPTTTTTREREVEPTTFSKMESEGSLSPTHSPPPLTVTTISPDFDTEPPTDEPTTPSALEFDVTVVGEDSSDLIFPDPNPKVMVELRGTSEVPPRPTRVSSVGNPRPTSFFFPQNEKEALEAENGAENVSKRKELVLTPGQPTTESSPGVKVHFPLQVSLPLTPRPPATTQFNFDPSPGGAFHHPRSRPREEPILGSMRPPFFHTPRPEFLNYDYFTSHSNYG